MLLLTYPAPYVNPSLWALPAIWGLTYPFCLLANLAFAIYFLVRKPVLSIIPITVIACGWNLLTNSVAFNLNTSNKTASMAIATPNVSSSTKSDAQQIKILSYNVKNFDLYSWQNSIQSRDNMMTLIKSEDADVLCFQEFYTETGGGEFQNLEMLTERLGYKYHYFAKSLEIKNKHLGQWGLAVFSRHPIVNTGRINFENAKHNMLTFADLNINNSMVRVFNTHLQSIHLGNDDMNYVRSISEGNEKSEETKSWNTHLKSSLTIVRKLKAAYAKRSVQAHQVVKQLQKSPHPYVICGDFNDTPVSYAYRTIAQQARDAFLEKGMGLGGTYIGPLPSFRIDYILLSEHFNIDDFNVIRKPYSDHFPISCSFSLGTSEQTQPQKGSGNSPIARVSK